MVSNLAEFYTDPVFGWARSRLELRYNQNHDELGRFAESDSSGGSDGSIEDKGSVGATAAGGGKKANKVDESVWRENAVMTRPENPQSDKMITGTLRDAKYPDELDFKLFHGSRVEDFKPGDLIEPGHPGNFVRRMKHVYAADSLEKADQYGGSVYEVRPLGPIGHRSDARKEQGYWASEWPYEVVRKVSTRKRIELRYNQNHDELGRFAESDFGTFGQAVYDKVREKGGVTIDVDGREPTEGYAYSASPDNEEIVDWSKVKPEDIDRYIDEHYDTLAERGNHLGMWVDGPKCYFDVTVVGPTNEETIARAQAAKQLAVYNLKTFETVNVGTRSGGKYEATHLRHRDRGQDQGAAETGSAGGSSEVSGGAGRGGGGAGQVLTLDDYRTDPVFDWARSRLELRYNQNHDELGRFAESGGGGGGVESPREDTPQQKAILRQSKAARATRRKFPPGTRVESVAGRGPTGHRGTVVRHVPSTNAQGGHLIVRWDSGTVGNAGPMALIRVDDIEPDEKRSAIDTFELRYNQNHDELGRFAESDSSGSLRAENDKALARIQAEVKEAGGPEAYRKLKEKQLREGPDYDTMSADEISQHLKNRYGITLQAKPQQVEAARSLARACDEYLPEFPQNNLSGIYITKLSQRDLWGQTIFDGKDSVVWISQARCNPRQDSITRRSYDEDIRRGDGVGKVGEDPIYATFRHEFGHVLDNSTGRVATEQVPDIVGRQYRKETGSKTPTKQLTWDSDFRSWIYKSDKNGHRVNMPSEYGGMLSFKSEVVAESFADVRLNGDKAKPVSKTIYKRLTSAPKVTNYDMRKRR